MFWKRVALVVTMAGMLAACDEEQKRPTTTPVKYAPNFKYQYPAGEAQAIDVTVAIVRPTYTAPGYTETAGYQEHPHVSAFRAAIATQLQEMMTQKGFHLTGPFDSTNDMTFPDKKTADLALTPQITLNWTLPTGGWKQGPPNPWTGLSERTYWSEGNCSATGFVSYILIEPLSGEKLWIKKVDVNVPEVVCTVRGGKDADRAYQDGIGRVLEGAYQAAMSKAWTYLSPEEFTLLKKKAQELREKKVY